MSDRFDLNEIERQVEGLRAAYPELWQDEDERLLADMLEGCTSFNELMNRVVERMEKAKELAKAQAALLKTLKARHDRYERRHEALRELAFKALQIADLRKLELAQATLSIARGPAKVIVTDPGALPEHCLRITIEPNRLVIKDRILHGETVPGATLSNGEETLKVST
jgi:Siphovirus Gp157